MPNSAVHENINGFLLDFWNHEVNAADYSSIIHRIFVLGQNHFLKSKTFSHDLMINQINEVEYLDLSHWMINVPKCFVSNENMQIQSAELNSENVSVNKPLTVEIDKHFDEHQLKSKNRRQSLPSRFLFNVKNTEDFSSPDQRSQFEVFESILKKLHQKYSREEYELLCKSCNMDLAVPQISSNGVYLGNNFIRLLMKKYKRNNELSYGNDHKIEQLLGDLGYSKN